MSSSLPGLLADHQIRALCVPPEQFFDERMYAALLDEQNRKGWPLLGYAVEALREQLRAQCLRDTTEEERAAFQPMISPYVSGQVREVYQTLPIIHGGVEIGRKLHGPGRKIISYGTSSYGYDVRCGREFKIFTNINSTIVDPKAFDEKNFVEVEGDSCIIPPNSFALARSIEYFRIPRNVLTVCLGKSTYARCGIIVNVTPLEPEWEGEVTLEFSNTTPLPAKIYANEGVAQMLFYQGSAPCEVSYADRKGKYQGQKGVTLPTV